jgi:aminoglycoside N3'-acetyltransferase
MIMIMTIMYRIGRTHDTRVFTDSNLYKLLIQEGERVCMDGSFIVAGIHIYLNTVM